MREKYEIEVQGRDLAETQMLVVELISELRMASPEVALSREKRASDTMDVGSIISLVLGSGAAAAVAQGISNWLKKRQSGSIKISKSGEVLAENLTSNDVVRIAGIFAPASGKGH